VIDNLRFKKGLLTSSVLNAIDYHLYKIKDNEELGISRTKLLLALVQTNEFTPTKKSIALVDRILCKEYGLRARRVKKQYFYVKKELVPRKKKLTRITNMGNTAHASLHA
jgi:hypothetical protein